MRVKQLEILTIAAAIAILNPAIARADDYVLTIRDHHFTPPVLEIPSNQKIKLIVDNKDATAEEFESYELNREKVVDGNSKITVFIGPLDPGTYPYFGDFHKDVATGKIVVK
ncbi:MAG TPA: cupredoxin domain-containing protein [Patescibacteria group bacterium]|nr:cupredoxin domain-containing protein [Patescibacteria group bacterium]